MIPLTRSCLGREEARAAARVISSGWLVQGPEVAAFERAFAEYTGAPYAVATSSCTTALHLALLLAGIGPGDEVICPSYSFVATANCILHTGAKPVLVDIDPLTFNLDPGAVEEAITPRTRAILPVHQLGLPAEMGAIDRIAGTHDLAVVEDAACALGSRYRGRMIGSLGNVACFSFHPRKVVTTGEGGMIAVPNRRLAERAMRLRTHGASVCALARHTARKVKFETYDEAGYNYRMTDLQAAIGIEQMKKIDYVLSRRLALAERYNLALEGVEGVQTPYAAPHLEGTYQTYAVRLRPPLDRRRDRILGLLLDAGVSARRGIPPIHLQPYWADLCGEMRLPVTEAVSDSSLFLPLFPDMKNGEQDYVIERLNRAVKRLT